MSRSEESGENRLEHLHRMVRNNVRQVGPWVQLGLELIRIGKEDEAKEALKRALELDPDNSYVKSRLKFLDTPISERAAVKTQYKFTPDVEVSRINQWIRMVFASLLIIVVLTGVKFCFFPSTQKLLVDKNHNSFPSWSPDGRFLGYYRVTGTGMQFKSLEGGEFYFADHEGQSSQKFESEDSESTWMPDREFKWSHDGEFLAFQRDYNLVYHVCIARRDGSDRVRIDPGGCICWSPVSNVLAYVSGKHVSDFFGSGENLMLYDMDTKHSDQLVEGSVESLSWSPDGQWIVYQSSDVRKKPAEAKSVKRSTSHHFGQMSSSESVKSESSTGAGDGFFRSFGTATNVYKVNAYSKETIALTNDGISCHPVWIPPGNQIIYLGRDEGWSYSMWIMNADGSGKKELYSSDNRFSAYTSYVADPKGDWIAFGGSTPLEEELEDSMEEFDELSMDISDSVRRDIFVARTDGSDIHRLKNLHDSKFNPTFSRNGKWIAYHVKPMGTKTQIWKTRVK
jgi:Tol biopolymer transport system component